MEVCKAKNRQIWGDFFFKSGFFLWKECRVLYKIWKNVEDCFWYLGKTNEYIGKLSLII